LEKVFFHNKGLKPVIAIGDNRDFPHSLWFDAPQ
jgi:hypothetical protein